MRPITEPPTQPAELLPVFKRLLPINALDEIVQNAPVNFYQRIFTPLVVLWGAVHQQLGDVHTCDSVLSFLGSGALDELDAALRAKSGSRAKVAALSKRVPKQNSSYCQSRQRLPLSVLQGALRLSAASIHHEVNRQKSVTDAATQAAPESTRTGEVARTNQGVATDRTVLLIDGSTLLLQSLPALRAHYGCHGNQHGPGHWPVLKVVGAFDLYTGAIVGVTEGTMKESEQVLGAKLIGEIATTPVISAAGQEPVQGMQDKSLLIEPPIYVGDRNFGVYSLVHAAVAHGNDMVVRMTAERFNSCLRRAGKAGRLETGSEHVLTWEPSAQDKNLLTSEQIGPVNQEQDTNKNVLHIPIATPEPSRPVRGRFIYWRLERPGYQPVDLHLFTTLLDESRYPAQALVELYGQRWHVELALRYVKDALGLSQLKARTLDTVRKELLAGCLAYNLIRGLMATAAIRAQLRPLDLSFKRCWRRIVDMANTWPPGATIAQTEARMEQLMTIMGYCTLYKSKQQRVQQRAVRKKPCPYPLLIGERESANTKS